MRLDQVEQKADTALMASTKTLSHLQFNGTQDGAMALNNSNTLNQVKSGNPKIDSRRSSKSQAATASQEEGKPVNSTQASEHENSAKLDAKREASAARRKLLKEMKENSLKALKSNPDVTDTIEISAKGANGEKIKTSSAISVSSQSPRVVNDEPQSKQPYDANFAALKDDEDVISIEPTLESLPPSEIVVTKVPSKPIKNETQRKPANPTNVKII